MPRKKRIILQPEYMSKFKCIGGACEDSCCKGWRVSVDKKTFLEYRRVKDEELKAMLDKYVKRERKEDVKSDDAYARVGLVNGSCPFLDAQSLCSVQNRLGYDGLCDVCAIYPRTYKLVDKKLERCATLSCPEVARIALFNEDGIAFEEVEEAPNIGRIPGRAPALAPSLTKNAAKPVKFFWDTRLFCLSILQNREYTLGQRLMLLGMLCRKLDELDKASAVEEIPAMLERFADDVESGSLKAGLDTVETNFNIQMRLAKELTDERLKTELVASQAYLVNVMETLAGIDFVAGTEPEDIIKKYTENRETYVAAYLKDKQYVLENFVVNEFFSHLMPFGSGEKAWDSYLFLCVLYGMVKLHINGIAGCRKGLTDEAVTRIVQTFSKTVLHNGKFIPNMIKRLKENGFDTLAWMAILVGD
jgi:lysine-N-methylase